MKKRFKIIGIVFLIFTLFNFSSCGKSYTEEELNEISKEIWAIQEAGELPALVGIYTKEGKLILEIHEDCENLSEIRRRFRKYGQAVKIELVDYYNVLY